MAFYGDGKHNEDMEYQKKNISKKMRYAVDVPPSYSDYKGNFEEWINIDYFETKREALEFVQTHFNADKRGKVKLISKL